MWRTSTAMSEANRGASPYVICAVGALVFFPENFGVSDQSSNLFGGSEQFSGRVAEGLGLLGIDLGLLLDPQKEGKKSSTKACFGIGKKRVRHVRAQTLSTTPQSIVVQLNVVL